MGSPRSEAPHGQGCPHGWGGPYCWGGSPLQAEGDRALATPVPPPLGDQCLSHGAQGDKGLRVAAGGCAWPHMGWGGPGLGLVTGVGAGAWLQWLQARVRVSWCPVVWVSLHQCTRPSVRPCVLAWLHLYVQASLQPYVLQPDPSVCPGTHTSSHGVVSSWPPAVAHVRAAGARRGRGPMGTGTDPPAGVTGGGGSDAGRVPEAVASSGTRNCRFPPQEERS